MTASHRQPKRKLQPPAFPVAPAYAALVLLFFAPHLLGLTAFPDSDFTRHFLPFSLFQQSALLELRLPLWDPHTFAGHPFLADAQSAVFYPVSNALLLLTSFDRSPAGRLYFLQAEAALHIFLACLFTYLLVRRLTGRKMAAFIAGAVFGFSGYLTGYVPLQLGILRVVVWLPAILLLLLPQASGTEKESAQSSASAEQAPPAATIRGRLFPHWKRWLAAAGVHAIAFFGGHPQTFLFLSYAVGGWMLMLCVSDLSRQRAAGPASKDVYKAVGARALLYAGMVSAYVTLLVLLTLAQLWPVYEFVQHSVRSSLTFQQAGGGFPLRDTLQYLLPGLLTDYSPQYVGVVAIGLAFITVAALFSSSLSLPGSDPHARAAAFFFVICGLAALLLSYGSRLPLYSLFYRFTPGGELFRGQERAIVLVAFSLSALSGYGMALLPTLTAQQRRTLCYGFAAAIAVGLTLLWVWRQLPARADIPDAALLQPAAMAMLIALAFAILAGSRLGRAKWLSDQPIARTRLILLIPLVLVDLFTVNFTTNLSFGPRVRDGLVPSEAAAALEASQSLAARSDSLPPRVYNEHRVSRNSGLLLGWEDVLGKSPLRHARYNAFITEFPLDRMWELTGTGTVLTWRHELPVESQLLAEFPRPETSTTYLHVLDAIAPRLWWTQRARVVDDSEALALLADPAFNIRDELLIPPSHAQALGSAWQDGRMTLGDGGQADLQVERVAAGHLRIRIQSAQPGLLFLSQKWLPGWQARWQGEQSLPVARANRAFLAIPVPAGSGILELVYRPQSVVWGLAVSAIAWLGLLIALRSQLLAAAQTAWRRAHEAFDRIKRKPAQRPTAPAFPREHLQRAGQRALSNVHLQRGALLAVILLGFLLRLYRLGFRELRGDESFGFFFSLHAPAQIVARTLSLREPHPVGSYLLQHAWLQVAGTNEFALRFIPVLAGTLAIPLVFRLARQLRLGAPTALAASLLLALNTYAIWHSQDARMYSLSLALTAAASVLALQVVRQPKLWPVPAAYALCAAVALQVHYYAAFVILAHNLFVLFLLLRNVWTRRALHPAGRFIFTLRSGDGALLTRWSLAQLLTVALCAPWFISAWQTLIRYGGNGDSPAFGAMLWRSLGVFALSEMVPHPIWRFAGGLLAGSLIVAGLLFGLRNQNSAENSNETVPGDPETQTGESPPNGAGDQQQTPPGQSSATVFLLLYLFIPLLATWFGARQRPIFDERYLVAALPPFLLLITVSAASMSSWIDTHLGWRWRYWVDREAGASGGQDSASDPATPLARIPLGRISAAALIILFLAANLYSLRNHYYEDRSLGWRALAETLDRWSIGLPPQDVRIAANFPDPTLEYYYKGDVQQFMIPPRPHDAEGAAQVVDSIIQDSVFRVILPASPAPNWDATGIAPDALASGFQKVLQEKVGIFAVHLYARPDPQSWQKVDAPFENGVTLTRAQVSPPKITAAGILVIHMDWRGNQETLTGGEKIFVHLLNESGGILSQADPILHLNSPKGFSSTALQLPATLPPGPLRLIVGLYDASLEGAPKILTEEGMDSVVLSQSESEVPAND